MVATRSSTVVTRLDAWVAVGRGRAHSFGILEHLRVGMGHKVCRDPGMGSKGEELWMAHAAGPSICGLVHPSCCTQLPQGPRLQQSQL